MIKKEMMILGILLLFFGASATPTVLGTIANTKDDDFSTQSYLSEFWKHPDITHFNLTNNFVHYPPNRQNYMSSYSYNDFSIIGTSTEARDPWIIYINDTTGDHDAFMWDNIAYNSHHSLSVSFDQEGYIWLAHGGYAHQIPPDLYKSNTKCSTGDISDYTLKLNNFETAYGAASNTIFVIGDTLNIFYRNSENDNPNTEIQHLQYDINDFPSPLIDRHVFYGEMLDGYPLTPCYTWSKMDPRYNVGFVTFCYKYSSPGMSGCWGSYPFTGIQVSGGSTSYFTGDGSSVSPPIRYSTNADIPLDNIDNVMKAYQGGSTLGVTPSGLMYQVSHQGSKPLSDVWHTLFINDGTKWNKKWTDETWSGFNVACGVTEDYVVLLYGDDQQLYLSVSSDDGTTWSRPTKIVEETHLVSGIAVAQPALYYTDNTLRVFYGTSYYDYCDRPYTRYRFIKFDAATFETPLESPPDKPDISGPSYVKPGMVYTYSFSINDQDDDDVFLDVNWGDGTIEEDLGPFESGDLVTLSHSWSDIGGYEISANTYDNFFLESGWSDSFVLEVIDPKIEIGPIVGGLFNVKTIIKNTGLGSAYNVNWSIDVFGGLIILGKESTGFIDVLPEDDEIEIRSDPIFGIGTVVLIIEAEMPEFSSDSLEKDAFILLFLTLLR